MNDISSLIQEAKARLRIPELWRILKPGDEPRERGGCRSPFRPDRHPSFSIFDDGRRWKDHATVDGGDAVDFLMHAGGLTRSAAIRRLFELTGICQGSSKAEFTWVPDIKAPPVPPVFPDVSSLRRPTDAEIETIALLRHLEASAAARAADWSILRTGTFHGQEVWALVDGPTGEPKRIAEVRRMDGHRIPSSHNAEGVKGLTIKGSKKDWPVGASLLAHPRASSHGVLLVEGMPDFLAAVHFATQADRFDLYPVAILGRSVKTLHPAAVALLSGRRIRAYPHADDDGGGMAAMERWAAQIPGATVDAFAFTGLHRNDGSPVNDLNDCAVIHKDDERDLWALLPESSPTRP